MRIRAIGLGTFAEAVQFPEGKLSLSGARRGACRINAKYQHVLYDRVATCGENALKRALESELYFYGKVLGFEPADDIEPVEIPGLAAAEPENG